MYVISRLGQLVHTNYYTHTHTHISQDNGVEDKVLGGKREGFQTARQYKKIISIIFRKQI